jgi:hypothetical protein
MHEEPLRNTKNAMDNIGMPMFYQDSIHRFFLLYPLDALLHFFYLRRGRIIKSGRAFEDERSD